MADERGGNHSLEMQIIFLTSELKEHGKKLMEYIQKLNAFIAEQREINAEQQEINQNISGFTAEVREFTGRQVKINDNLEKTIGILLTIAQKHDSELTAVKGKLNM